MKRAALFLIRVYQYTFSPDHGPIRHFFIYGCCRFRPSCSEYTYHAIEKYGLIKGCSLGLWRVVRCNPWNSGGDDPVK